MGIFFLLFSFFSASGGQISETLEPTCKNSFLADINVVGGEDITAQDVPWNVVLEIKKKENNDKIETHCGGSIISPTIILTAAHCLWLNQYSYGHKCPEHVRNQQSAIQCHQLEGGCPNGCIRMRPQDLNVYIGITNITEKDRSPKAIKRIILHDLWNKSSSSKESILTGHDLALLVLETELQFNTKVRPICLPDPNYQHLLRPDEHVYINGFGIIDVETRTLADHLQTGHMQIKSKADCNDDYDIFSKRTNERIIQGDQVCAYADGTDSCNGDSGSGLIKYEGPVPVLVGVVSFGHKACRDVPGVYTNVQTHVDWILQKATPPPVDCIWAPWSDFSACRAPNCRSNGAKTRTRTIQTQPRHGGAQCTGEATQTLRCTPSNTCGSADERCSDGQTCKLRKKCPEINSEFERYKAMNKNEPESPALRLKLKALVCHVKPNKFCCPNN